MSVGDINSSEVGTGARFNDGKPPFQLVTARAIAASYSARQVFDDVSPKGIAVNVLFALGAFQEGGDIHDLARAMSYAAGYWPSCARTFDYGLKKYAAWNWAKGMAWSVCIACCVRHCLAILRDDELLDPESGEHHLGHVLCNLVMLFHYVGGYPAGDDRPPARYFHAEPQAIAN